MQLIRNPIIIVEITAKIRSSNFVFGDQTLF